MFIKLKNFFLNNALIPLNTALMSPNIFLLVIKDSKTNVMVTMINIPADMVMHTVNIAKLMNFVSLNSLKNLIRRDIEP